MYRILIIFALRGKYGPFTITLGSSIELEYDAILWNLLEYKQYRFLDCQKYNWNDLKKSGIKIYLQSSTNLDISSVHVFSLWLSKSTLINQLTTALVN